MGRETSGGMAVIFGATGGIGSALTEALRVQGRHERVIGLSRSAGDNGEPGFDLTDEASIEAAATYLSGRPEAIRLAIDATGYLHDARFAPERSLGALDPEHMQQAFALNAIGPALLMKHILPLLPRQGRSVFASLSARVGSIGDNELGGWHSYRASKAALNQFVRGAAIETGRRRKEAICVALHPGTVDTRLSEPFSKSGLDVRPPEEAARDILAVLDGLESGDTGGFFDHKGKPVPW